MEPTKTFDLAGVLAQREAGLPRYTSYPSANHFAAGAGPGLEVDFVRSVAQAQEVSVYVHVPYCDRLCWFCGCHTKQTRKYEPIAEFVDTLVAEIGLWRQRLEVRPTLSALHFGGGSPSLLRPAEWKKLHEALKATFDFSAKAEIAVEIDPSDSNDDLIKSLTAFGVNRVSIGVQDFDPAVQAAINRPQTYEQTAALVFALRKAGIKSINIDALYGLPLQDETRLAATLDKVISLSPDRVALFGYAHVPWMRPHQKLIDEATLPDQNARLKQALLGRALLLAHGYEDIGIDHFAKPTDSLALARRNGRLTRNFQGYTTDLAEVRIGLGPSAIGAYPGGFVQNEVAIGNYTRMVAAGQLPLGRGLALTPEDRVRGHVINRLMCQFGFSFAELARLFGPDAARVISVAKLLAAMDNEGLCQVDDAGFQVTAQARLLVRIVAAKFDTWLSSGEKKYSKAV